MRQPEIGQKIAELRKQKGFTQEDLAFECQLNVRSVQRIETGEVEPRISTLKILSEVLDFEFNGNVSTDTRVWLALMHLSSFIPIVVFALVIWISKRDDYPIFDKHGKDVINFQISMCLYLFAASMLVFVLIGVPILIGLGFFIGFISIFNSIKVAMDNEYRYPLTIQFIK